MENEKRMSRRKIRITEVKYRRGQIANTAPSRRNRVEKASRYGEKLGRGDAARRSFDWLWSRRVHLIAQDWHIWSRCFAQGA